MNRLFYVVITLIMITGSIVLFGDSVYSMEKNVKGDKALNSYYKELEREYIKKATSVLNENGYTNAGVMLTYVSEEDGSRYYTLSIHHKLVGRDEVKDESIAENIEAIGFEIPCEELKVDMYA